MALVYGINSVLEALKAPGARVERVSVERGRRNPRLREIEELARGRRVPIAFEERAWLDRKAGGEPHQGVVCQLAEIETGDAEDLLAQARAPGLVLVLDGIEDPHNLGAILRSAEVAGAGGVLVSRRRTCGGRASATQVRGSRSRSEEHTPE